MHVDLVPFPVGAWQGLTAIRARFTGEAYGRDMIHMLRSRAVEGVQVIWLESEDWGTEAWDDFLRGMLADPRLGEFPITTIRDLANTNWANVDLEWILDISETFGTEMERDTLHRTLSHIKYVPDSREIVWRDPPASSITPIVMDMIAETLRPEIASWIYTEDEDTRALAQTSATRATSVWGVRPQLGEAWSRQSKISSS